MKQLAVILLATVGCSVAESPAPRSFCTERSIGDLGAPIEVTIVSRDRTGHVQSVLEAAPVWVALSSGERGVVLSIHARNLDGCAVAVAIRNLDDGRQGGAMVELDDSGQVDPDNPMSFIELGMPTDGDTINVAVEDAMGRWATVRWSP